MLIEMFDKNIFRHTLHIMRNNLKKTAKYIKKKEYKLFIQGFTIFQY